MLADWLCNGSRSKSVFDRAHDHPAPASKLRCIKWPATINCKLISCPCLTHPHILLPRWSRGWTTGRWVERGNGQTTAYSGRERYGGLYSNSWSHTTDARPIVQPQWTDYTGQQVTDGSYTMLSYGCLCETRLFSASLAIAFQMCLCQCSTFTRLQSSRSTDWRRPFAKSCAFTAQVTSSSRWVKGWDFGLRSAPVLVIGGLYSSQANVITRGVHAHFHQRLQDNQNTITSYLVYFSASALEWLTQTCWRQPFDQAPWLPCPSFVQKTCHRLCCTFWRHRRQCRWVVNNDLYLVYSLGEA